MIDHFMYGVPDLAAGIAWSELTFGVAAVPGGRHEGLGTCNALLSFGDTYLEIIAPDRTQSLASNFGGRLAGLSGGGLITWCARGNLPQVRETLQSRGVECTGPVTTRRATPQGELLEWQLLFPRNHAFGGRLPFFIDWLACAHPSTTNPLAGTLETFQVMVENTAAYRALMAGLVPRLAVLEGRAGLLVEVMGRNGLVELRSTPETADLSMFNP